MILKNIESDLDKADSVKLESCNIKPDIYSGYDGKDKDDNDLSGKFTANNCLKFNYGLKPDGTVDVAYLGIYYYKNKESYVISYIHDDVKATRLLPDFEETVSIDSSNNMKSWTLNGQSIQYKELNGFNIINIPIIGPDGKDYGINISYYK